MIFKKMSTKKIIVFLVSICIVWGIICFIYVALTMEEATTDNWYMSDLKELCVDYARTIDTSGGTIEIQKYSFIEYNQKIAEENKTRLNKEYPFSGVTAYIHIGDMYYYFYIVKDEQGELYVQSHELA